MLESGAGLSCLSPGDPPNPNLGEHRWRTRNQNVGEVKMSAKKQKRWVAKVTTDSTHPPKGLFKKSAAVIARTLASPKVSPKGPGSGMRMLLFYMNRAGRNLDAKQRAELEKAKELLHKRVQHERDSDEEPT